ncbi:MAG: hypothetical protein WCB05_02385, partial [Candidatus Sulfotelmatobacter sp.]
MRSETKSLLSIETALLGHVEESCLVRILIVDDSATARAALRAALEQRLDWWVVGEAFDGHHALTTFHLHMPHLTLIKDPLHVDRPELTQHDVAACLQVTPPHVPIATEGADPPVLFD